MSVARGATATKQSHAAGVGLTLIRSIPGRILSGTREEVL